MLGPQFQRFSPGDSEFTFRHAPQSIDSAIDEYPAIINSLGGGEAAPYNAESMAEIYHPRVRRLMDLQGQGFTHAAWGRLNVSKENTWHPVAADAPEVVNPAKSEAQSRKNTARYMN